MKFNDATVRVRYAETDAMGFVYHANFLLWFEVGRAEYMRAAGFPYKKLEQDEHVHLPVLECACRFVHPARYDDLITIRASIVEVSRVKLTFNYQALHTETGTLLAEGHTTHVFTDRVGKPQRLKSASPFWKYLAEQVKLA